MERLSRKPQIGVMGSAADLHYAAEIEKLAEEIGAEIARAGATLVFGAEKDYDSLSTAACRGAKREGGLTVGVTYGKGLNNTFDQGNTDVVIATAMERGGGRETVLVTSCDGLILVSGGSGTLTEAAVAYQANRPITAMKNTGGWADKLIAEPYIDGRKRVRVEAAETAQEAVTKIIKRIIQRSLLIRSKNRIKSFAELELFREDIDWDKILPLDLSKAEIWIFESPMALKENGAELLEFERNNCLRQFEESKIFAVVYRSNDIIETPS